MKITFLILVALAASLASPASCLAWDLDSLLRSIWSSASSDDNGEVSSGRDIRSNSEVLGDMNPLDDRDLYSDVLSKTDDVSRSDSLDYEIEMYKKKHGIDESLMEKAERHIRALFRKASSEMEGTKNKAKAKDPIENLEKDEKKILYLLLEKMLAD